MESAAAAAPASQHGQPAAPAGAAAAAARRGAPLPLRPRGGFGGYLHELRGERGLTIRELAAAAGVHHTYVSKLERGDRQAPDDAVVEALAAALAATPAQIDQLRWRAGLAPHAGGAPGHDDPTLTLVAEALSDGSRPAPAREQLRRTIAQAVRTQGDEATAQLGGRRILRSAQHDQGAVPSHSGGGEGRVPYPRFAQRGPTQRAAPTGEGGTGRATAVPPADGRLSAFFPAPGASAAPEPAAPDGRAALLAGLLGGWQTLDEAAAELRVAPGYLWELIQGGYLRAWSLPGAPAGSPAGVRVRREDVLGLLQPVQPAHPAGR